MDDRNQARMESLMMPNFDWDAYHCQRRCGICVVQGWVRKTMLVGSILDYEWHCDIFKASSLFFVVDLGIVLNHCLFNNALVTWLALCLYHITLCALFALLLLTWTRRILLVACARLPSCKTFKPVHHTFQLRSSGSYPTCLKRS